ncbi:hypothetical protein Cni_G16047 [Canna indica]|uniref:Uncharacterized protein n=1 Tax=Canna indica TaxID=4628 RepID=A0AAQ3KJE6_9LILI|nr:hypothetical protein Cni_G16047 [Canna indica]
MLLCTVLLLHTPILLLTGCTPILRPPPPPDEGRHSAFLRSLRALFLDHNLFSGPFPDALLFVRDLRVLDLSHNCLAGPLPLALVSLPELVSLCLEDNRFNDSIPAFNQSSLRSFKVSGNDLSGVVPVTDVLASFDSSVFADNPALYGAIVRKECASNTFFPSAGSSPAAAGAPSPGTTAAPYGRKFLPGSVSPSRVSRKKGCFSLYSC